MLVVALILLSSYTSVHAQTYTFGNSAGNGADMWIANSDRTNHYGHFRAQTGATSFTLTNYGNRFALSYLSTFATDFNNIGTEVITFTSTGGIMADGYISAGGTIGASGNITSASNIVAGGNIICNGNITNIGNVGIGTSAPTQKLDVNGNAYINGNILQTNNGTGISWGNNYSKIKDNGNLQILTDDYFYIGKSDSNGNMAGTTMFANVVTGNVGIGTINPTAKLHVNGKINATDYAVVTAVAADYVFEKDYKLMSLSDTEAYIKANKHLPAFKSAKHYETNGYTMIEMNVALEQTIEEMTLHAIAQEKEINNLKSDMAQIKAMLLKK